MKVLLIFLIPLLVAAQPESAQELATPYSQFEKPSMESWSSYKKVEEAFTYLRDTKFFDWSYKQFSMKRRISWLFPYDGCDIRAELAVQKLENFGEPLPNKIFAFGSFMIHSPYLPGGLVVWKMHVAPIVRVKNRYLVLDPTMNFNKPLPLKTWLKKLNPHTNIDFGVDPTKISQKQIRVAICHPKTLNEQSDCYSPKSHDIEDLSLYIQDILSSEWVNLKALGFDQAQLLGDAPPWLK